MAKQSLNRLVVESKEELATWVETTPSRFPLFPIWNVFTNYFKVLNVLGGLTQALNSLGAPRASTSRVAVGPSVCRDAGGSY